MSILVGITFQDLPAEAHFGQLVNFSTRVLFKGIGPLSLWTTVLYKRWDGSSWVNPVILTDYTRDFWSNEYFDFPASFLMSSGSLHIEAYVYRWTAEGYSFEEQLLKQIDPPTGALFSSLKATSYGRT